MFSCRRHFLIPLMRAIGISVVVLATQGSRADLPPSLEVSISGGNLQLFWPAGATDWMMCASTGLASGDWTLVSEVPTVLSGQNVVTLPVASKGFYQLRHRGAVVPFTTLEAEDTGSTTGGVIRMITPPTGTTWTPELEASGRGFVQLDTTGAYLDFTNTVAANALVIRHCIPDAPAGGGITATLSLYVNGVFRQKLALSSKHNWLYGDGTQGSNGNSNDPTFAGATPHVFWDEERAFIAGGLQAGDTLRLQKDADDTAAYYRIDLVDLETAPPPLSPPPPGTYLSVTDYGANGSDAIDDTAAIESCIAAATVQGKTVWFPAGTYYQTRSFTLDSVVAQGAGMWHTAIIGTEPGGAANNIGFRLRGDGASVRDLFIECSAQTQRSSGGYAILKSNAPGATLTDWSIENVWIMHTVTGPWMSDSFYGTIRGCRIRGTYADGIHVNSSDVVVEHNHIRGTGDDGIALYSPERKPVNVNQTARFNTVIANWHAQNLSISGGSGIVVEDNYLADVARAASFSITHAPAFPVHPMTGAMVRRNTIVRGGGNIAGQKRGAIWIWPGNTTISGVTISDNDIRDAIFRGIHLLGDQSHSISWERNVIDRPGEDGIEIPGGVVGSGIFIGNIVRNLNLGFVPFNNRGGSDYTVTLSGNSW